jgi:hypothetical protein
MQDFHLKVSFDLGIHLLHDILLAVTVMKEFWILAIVSRSDGQSKVVKLVQHNNLCDEMYLKVA